MYIPGPDVFEQCDALEAQLATAREGRQKYKAMAEWLAGQCYLASVALGRAKSQEHWFAAAEAVEAKGEDDDS